MVLLRENLIHLQYIGVWPSTDWSSDSWQARVYRLYTLFVICALYWFCITESVSLFSVLDSIENFSDNCFMLLTSIVVCFKVDMIMSKRRNVIELINVFEAPPHKPMSVDEERIQKKFDDRSRSILFICGGGSEVAVWIMTISVFFQEIPFGELPYKAWIPYDYSKSPVYWCTFCLQLFVVIFLANVAIGFDSTVMGLFMLICAKFNILKYRLDNAINEFDKQTILRSEMLNSRIVKICERQIIDCVEYHQAIFKISGEINSLIKRIIFVQYSASTIIICISTLMISQMPLASSKALFVLLYLGCMLLQIFVFCISANEATIQCENLLTGISNSKWYALTNRARGYLILMMVRTLRPIGFKSGHLFIFSLDAFSTLLRRSYSAYTMLQQSSK